MLVFYQLFRYTIENLLTKYERQTNVLLSSISHKWEFLRISASGNICVMMFSFHTNHHHTDIGLHDINK